MEKLKLQIEALRVQSSQAATGQPAQRTVNGHDCGAGCVSYCRPCFFTRQAACTERC